MPVIIMRLTLAFRRGLSFRRGSGRFRLWVGRWGSCGFRDSGRTVPVVIVRLAFSLWGWCSGTASWLWLWVCGWRSCGFWDSRRAVPVVVVRFAFASWRVGFGGGRGGRLAVPCTTLVSTTISPSSIQEEQKKKLTMIPMRTTIRPRRRWRQRRSRRARSRSSNNLREDLVPS
jgi:hypothetical protein